RPLTALNSVLLPAPFGPMSPRISPGSTSIETSLRATTPPNAMVTSRKLRMAIGKRDGGSPVECFTPGRHMSANEPVQSIREEDDAEHQDGAEDDLLDALHRAEDLGQQ